MESKKYILKNIGPQVPLFDPSTKNYMIVVDGEPLDINEKLFKTLFIESESESKQDSSDDTFSLFNIANSSYEVLKDQIKNMENAGISKDAITQVVVDVFKDNPEMQEFAKNLLDSIK